MPTIKIKAGKYYQPVTIEPFDSDSYKLSFGFNRDLIEEIKNFEGAKWNPAPQKYWTIKKSPRNQFTLEYLCGKNPYKKWLSELVHYEPNRDILMTHQRHMLDVVLNRRQVILAAEPGTGKSLVIIEVIEVGDVSPSEVLWVSPHAGIRAVEIELMKWESGWWPVFSTYDSLKKIVANWPSGKPPFKLICFDESHMLRNMQTQRYEAAKHIVNAMYEEYDDPYVICMSGTVSPKDPSNWYGQVELLRPGWLREPNIIKFKKRLALIKDEESIAGGFFPKLITWWDNEDKCRICGQFKDDPHHDINSIVLGYEYHEYQKSVNEVANLYKRLKGIVDITFKKDVLKDLPEKVFKIIRCTPSEETLRAAQLVVANARNAVSAAIQLRELSDGFLYKDVATDELITCPLCNGRKIIDQPAAIVIEECLECGGSLNPSEGRIICVSCGMDYTPESYDIKELECPHCIGQGVIEKRIREAQQIPCEKEQIVKDLLEEYDGVGRVVIYAGFQGSVDRNLKICKEMGWETIRVDGRGWLASENLGRISELKMLQLFQDKGRQIPKLAFVANPDAGGIALTLTESPVEIFYSNSFIASSRPQAIDRIHRPGASRNRGVTIIDIINLPSDQKVLDTLNNNQRLQSLTLGDFASILK